MFGLQRTVVFVNDQGLDVFHQRGIAVHFGLGGKTLVDNKVVVAFQGMAIDAGIVVAVAGNELLEVGRGFGQVFDVEGHVFDEAGRARLACSAYAGEDARPDGPELAVLCRIVGEVYGYVGTEGRERLFDGSDVGLQFFRRASLGFRQYGGETRGIGCFSFFIFVIDGVVY